MAQGSSPLSALMAAQVVNRLAARGNPGGGGAGVSAPDVSGEQLQNQFSQLQGADPEMATKLLQQIKQMLVSLYLKTSFEVPEASRHIAKAQQEIDQALKAIQQAAATLNAVRPQIANRAALPPGFNPSAPEGGGNPETGGIGGL